MFFWKRSERAGAKQQGSQLFSPSLDQNLTRFKTDILANDETIVYRQFATKGAKPRRCLLISADNMVKHEFLSEYIVRPLMEEELPKRLQGEELVNYIAEQVIHSDSVDFVYGYLDAADKLMDGVGILFIDGCRAALAVDAQGWAKRAVIEPPSEAVVRGPRQGFTEDLGVNISLVRRRLTGPNFKTIFLNVGLQSRTKVAILYLENVASQELLDEVKRRIEAIEIDAVLDSGYIEELIQDAPYCPLPTIGQTERPDVVAGKILEGRVAVLVDGSPFALTMPYLFLEAFQANEDYYNHWVAASLHRMIRYLAFLITTSTPAIYLALISFHSQLIPTNLVLSISASRKNVPFPGIVEVVAMGLVFEILREGGLRLPRPVGQAISIVGAIILGEAAVSATLVSAPMIIMVGITGVAGFVVADLNDVAILIRLIFVLLASILGLYGYIIGVIGLVLQLSSLKSFGVPYLSSLSTFTSQGIKDTVIRVPWWQMVLRPKQVGAKNLQRLERKGGKQSR